MERASILDPVAILLPIVVAFDQGWHHIALRALLFSNRLITWSEDFAGSAIRESAFLFSTALLIMFSVLCASVVLDVAGGFLGRLVPRLQIQSELLVIKLLAGGAVAWLLSSVVSIPRWLECFSVVLEAR